MTQINVTKDFLSKRLYYTMVSGYPKQKWIGFCETLLKIEGVTLTLYEATQTRSKYIRVLYKGHCYKVRFSNHKASHNKEIKKDCDFFVGIGYYKTTRTEDALQATYSFLDNIDKGISHAN